jgi:hypothetical protein
MERWQNRINFQKHGDVGEAATEEQINAIVEAVTQKGPDFFDLFAGIVKKADGNVDKFLADLVNKSQNE